MPKYYTIIEEHYYPISRRPYYVPGLYAIKDKFNRVPYESCRVPHKSCIEIVNDKTIFY